MGKKLAILLMIAMTLSGCGAVKNLENPGFKPAPQTPEDYSVVWFGHRFSEEAAMAIRVSVWVLCIGVASTCFSTMCMTKDVG